MIQYFFHHQNLNKSLKFYTKKGFILIQTLLLLSILSLFMINLTKHHQALKQQVYYYQQAKELSQVHIKIVENIRSELPLDYIDYLNYQINFEQENESLWNVYVNGPHSFNLMIHLNVDKRTIKSYNYVGLVIGG